MQDRTRGVLRLFAIALVSAAIASFLTIHYFVNNGFLKQTMVWPEDTSSDSSVNTTSASLSANTTPNTTTRLTLSTTSPTTTATTEPTTTTETAHLAAWHLSLWQVQEQLETIYQEVAPSVVGLKVEVPATATTNARQNTGSALIMGEDGIIAVNTSTIALALERSGELKVGAVIEVYIQNHPEVLKAELVGNDMLTGISVLSIDATKVQVKPAMIAESPKLQVGQMVISIGYPEMMHETGGLSNGFITAINREMKLEDGTALSMIQTDAFISQSYSGGPLLNLDGEVIGLTNSAVDRDISDAMGYALPIQVVQQVTKNLVTQGYVSGRAWLGVTVLQENNFLELQSLYQFPDGLYISSVIKDSPAYTADLRKGDIITKINGEPVETHESLMMFLQSQAIGAMVEIEVYRKSDGRYYQQKVFLQEYQR